MNKNAKPLIKRIYQQRTFLQCRAGLLLLPNGSTHAIHQHVNTHYRKRFSTTVKKYQAQNCKGCPLRSVCHQSKDNRTIEINHQLIQLKSKANENLKSEQGIEHRKRCYTIEPVFACLKQNKNFKRFMLRSLPKVEIEAGLCLIGFNLKQKHS